MYKLRIWNSITQNNYLSIPNWGHSTFTTCEGQKQPNFGSKYPGYPHEAELELEKVLGSISKQVHLLSITSLSQLQKDGHPSIYTGHGRHNKDCTHWCLPGPGFPYTWNILLYAFLIQN